MSKLIENTELYSFLKSKYRTIHYRFKKAFGTSFPYEKFDIDSIKGLRLDGIKSLSGIEELKSLETLTIKDIDDLAPLEKCNKIASISCILSHKPADIKMLRKLSKMKNIKNFEIFGDGVKYISEFEALQFGKNCTISYNKFEALLPEQFSKIQSKLLKIGALVNENMTDIEKVKIVYKNLLSDSFEYNHKNNSKDLDEVLINNTLYGPLVEEKGSSFGIASALETALRYVGLEAVSCEGWLDKIPSHENLHKWNQVKVDGKWYNLDLANDYGKKSWKFFMKSDNDCDWAECHYIDKSDKLNLLHDCVSTKYNAVYKEAPKERKIRELKENRNKLINNNQCTPYSDNYKTK